MRCHRSGPTGPDESTSETTLMTTTAPSIDIPGYRAGTWTIDPAHSEVGFQIRHLMISKVKGKFERFDATFVTAENPLDSSVTASAEVASVSTNEPNRDAHLRTGDFFEAETYPTIDFVSTGVRVEGGDFKVDGDLTIRGITKPVTFDFDFGGFGGDPYGNYKAGATAKAVINREDFGLHYNAALETGGVLLGDQVTITLELQAQLAQ
jgi:polyisoprenoid-binding protein YceI